MEVQRLRFDSLVGVGDWHRQLSAVDWIDDRTFVGIGKAYSNDAFERFRGAQVRALDLFADTASVTAAVAGLIPAHYRLLVWSTQHRLALWQDDVGGPLTLLHSVPAKETHRFPHPRERCPFGHVMPQKNTHETLDDFFAINTPKWFDEAATRFEAQLDAYFGLPDFAAREAWLDRRDHGLGRGESHAERLDSLMAAAEPFARCTARCGYFHWRGCWLQASV